MLPDPAARRRVTSPAGPKEPAVTDPPSLSGNHTGGGSASGSCSGSASNSSRNVSSLNSTVTSPTTETSSKEGDPEGENTVSVTSRVSPEGSETAGTPMTPKEGESRKGRAGSTEACGSSHGNSQSSGADHGAVTRTPEDAPDAGASSQERTGSPPAATKVNSPARTALSGERRTPEGSPHREAEHGSSVSSGACTQPEDVGTRRPAPDEQGEPASMCDAETTRASPGVTAAPRPDTSNSSKTTRRGSGPLHAEDSSTQEPPRRAAR